MADHAAPLDVAQLVADYHQALYRYAYRLCGSQADAEDLTQEVFLIAQRKLDQLRNADCVRGWLYTVLRNCFAKSYRQRLPLPVAGGDFDIGTIPDEILEPSFDSERLQEALDALDEEFKTVLLLFYFEYRSYRDIAQLLDVPVGTVMSRLARAKGHLRRLLSETVEQPATAPGHDSLGGSRFPAFRQPTATRN